MLKAFQMSDEELWCAETAEQAAASYLEETGCECEDDYPQELSDAQLDAPQPAFDENEAQIDGEKTCVREMLAEMTAPGFLASSVW
ncbi:MAG TPA: hypothetical protein VJ823_01345 [Rhodanobacteraceae bacterium]|nr:hypothetical protein [Rhodanobacteraceae bacterium]